MKHSITAGERLQLIGLLSLAEHHNASLKEIEHAACRLLDIDEQAELLVRESDHVSDAIYGNTSIGELLHRLNVAVLEESGG